MFKLAGFGPRTEIRHSAELRWNKNGCDTTTTMNMYYNPQTIRLILLALALADGWTNPKWYQFSRKQDDCFTDTEITEARKILAQMQEHERKMNRDILEAKNSVKL